jgi:hypothetical protein
VIPDGDIDICVHYGADYKTIIKCFEQLGGWKKSKVMLNDANHNSALYAGVECQEMGLYVCISFWYPWEDYLFWCHDQKQEVGISQEEPPKSGYWFKGCPRGLLEGENKFIMVEWPGIRQCTKVRVPVFAGTLLDLCYPGFGYWIQRYNIENYRFEQDKCVSVNDPVFNKSTDAHAISPYMVHVSSMADFTTKREEIKKQLAASKSAWEESLKTRFMQ